MQTEAEWRRERDKIKQETRKVAQEARESFRSSKNLGCAIWFLPLIVLWLL